MREISNDVAAAIKNKSNCADPVIDALSRLRSTLTEANIQILNIEQATPDEFNPKNGVTLKVALYVPSESFVSKVTALES